MPKDILKVVIIGDGGVGKTCLRNQFIHKRFTSSYKATIGADFITKDVHTSDGRKVTLQLWDTAGQERFQSLGVSYYRGADACCLVYDTTNFQTFHNLGKCHQTDCYVANNRGELLMSSYNLERWRADFLKQSSLPQELLEEFPLILIGNKIDIDDRVVSRRQARAWAQQHSSPRMEIRCFEASAKDGTNVEEAFSCIAGMVKIPQLELDMDGNDGFQLNRREDSFRGRKSCAC